LVGTSISDQIKIKTKKRGVEKCYILIIDSKGIREEIHSRKPLIAVMEKYVKLFEEPENKEDHYTEVEISVVKEALEKFKDNNTLESFIGQTLPVKFNPNFKFKDKITKFLEDNIEDYKEINILLNGKEVYRPTINEVEDPIPKGIWKGKKNYGYYWVCIHQHTKKIQNKFVAGLVFKQKGITVGNRETCRFLFPEGSQQLYEWVTGEIHVTSPDVIPDIERTNFEWSEAREELREILQKEMEVIAKDLRKKSGKEHATKDIKYAIQRYEEIRDIIKNPQTKWYDKIMKIPELEEIKSDIDDRLNKIVSIGIKTQGKNTVSEIGSLLEDLRKIRKKARKIQKDIQIEKGEKVTEKKIQSLSEIIDSSKLDEPIKNILKSIDKILSEKLETEDYNLIVDAIINKLKDKLKIE